MATQAQRTAQARRRLLDATAALIAQHGVANTSVAAIGELADMSRGAANFHFGSKDELVLALAEEVSQELEANATAAASAQRDGTVEEFVDQFLDAHCAMLERNPSRARLVEILTFEASGPSPQLREPFIRLHRRLRDHLAETIESLRARGVVSASVDASAAATLLLAICRGVTAQHLLDPDDVDLGAAGTEARRTLLAALQA